MRTVKDLRDRLMQEDLQGAWRLIYEWTKNETINRSDFMALIRELIKRETEYQPY